MNEVMTFVHQHAWFVIIVVAFTCILAGRIWSDKINRGEITEPHLVIKKDKYYKVINTYVPSTWTEDWIIGSIICLKSYRKKMFIRYSRDIYISGDRIRFTDGGPLIGSTYQAAKAKIPTGPIIMTPVKQTGIRPNSSPR